MTILTDDRKEQPSHPWVPYFLMTATKIIRYRMSRERYARCSYISRLRAITDHFGSRAASIWREENPKVPAGKPRIIF